MNEIVDQLGVTGLVFFGLALVLGIVAAGSSKWERNELVPFFAWIFLGLAAIFWLLAIWGPVVL